MTAPPESHQPLPLSTLLSFAWTAFTIEIDNAFEMRMPHRTTRGGGSSGPWLVSHAMWWTCMRFVDATGIHLRDLEARARTRTNLNGMIRWGYVVAETASDEPVKRARSGNPLIRARRNGLRARDVWQPLPEEVEHRWRQRIGDAAIDDLIGALGMLVTDLDPCLPDCMPILGYGLRSSSPLRHAQPADTSAQTLPLVVMLARVLLAFTLEYECAAGLSLAIGANVLRLIEADGIHVRDMPRAAGASKEAIAMALGLLQRRQLAEVTAEGRSRVTRLTPSGVDALAEYQRTVRTIETQWRTRFGPERIVHLRQALETVVTGPSGEALLTEALTAPPDGWRAATRPPHTLPWQPMVLHRGGYPDGA
jgi:hypothetical protein